MFTQKLINQTNIKNDSRRSWFDIVEEEKNNKYVSNKMEESENYIPFTNKEKDDKEQKERDIEIDFFDPSNEEKFDRLVKEDKIKTPLKRRPSDHSNTSDNSFENEAVSESTVKVLKRARTTTSSSTSSDQNEKKKKNESETDPEVLQRRQKQIDYGKNTIGYDNYIASIRKRKRLPEHPKTPPKTRVYSRRAWEGLVKEWRKKLHNWDDKTDDKDKKSDDLDVDNDSDDDEDDL